MQGSTFTITSIGPLRVEGFTPRLNTPEVGILGIGAIRDEPAVVNGKVMPRKMLTLSLTFDHRALDGAEAARFLTTLVNLIEDTELLVLEGV
jgi:pyruvate dehydrogenase E2 component (dihydrolipoamide acetyltransferase)